jgi:L-fuconolactonase
MAEAAHVLDGYPDLTVVVEHVGWPTAFDPDHVSLWRDGMRRLAELRESVHCKLSGIAMATHSPEVDAVGPWFRDAVDLFGADRCLVGSNFPVDGVFGSFDAVLGAYLTVLELYGDEAVAAMFAGNTERVYRIEAPPPPTGGTVPTIHETTRS